MRNHFCFSGNL